MAYGRSFDLDIREQRVKRVLAEEADSRLRDVHAAIKDTLAKFSVKPSQIRRRYIKSAGGPLHSYHSIEVKDGAFPKELRELIIKQVFDADAIKYGTVQPGSIAITGSWWIKISEFVSTPEKKNTGFVEVLSYKKRSECPEANGLVVLDWVTDDPEEAIRHEANAYESYDEDSGEYTLNATKEAAKLVK